jgi:hypothetical protein
MKSVLLVLALFCVFSYVCALTKGGITLTATNYNCVEVIGADGTVLYSGPTATVPQYPPQQVQTQIEEYLYYPC